MKKIFSKIAFTAFCAFAIISCKDDATSSDPVTPPTGTKEYYSMKTGAYWIYENYDLTAEGGIDAESITFDSVAVTGAETIDGKAAFNINRFMTTTGETPLAYAHSFTSDQFYVTDNFLKAFPIFDYPMFSELTIPNYGWLKLADSKDSNWNLLPTAIELKGMKIPIEYEGISDLSADLSFQVKMIRKETGTAIDPVTSKSVNTITYEVKFDISGTAKAKLGLAPITAPLTGGFSSYMVYGEGIGLMRIYSPKQKFTISATFMGFPVQAVNEDIDGSESILRRYKK